MTAQSFLWCSLFALIVLPASAYITAKLVRCGWTRGGSFKRVQEERKTFNNGDR